MKTLTHQRQALVTLRDYATDHLRLYPDPTSKALREALAETFQVASSQVFVGNGSDEVLALAFQAFFRHGAPLDAPAITYSFYPVYANLYGVELRKHPLNEQWKSILMRLEQRLTEAALSLPTQMRQRATRTHFQQLRRCLSGSRIVSCWWMRRMWILARRVLLR
ncbi:hypothetical protein HORIV_57340 [Vreelandella olivaria]|uniref:Aminotransferase class I/classII large domain-containing protein n=1 Tax=Vreelandella olivaria TaxID=390919 RepID=A0ABM7GRL6_9GAMM|nr:hypothetical protein HORIV_57340 [Halomonas olivaria]